MTVRKASIMNKTKSHQTNLTAFFIRSFSSYTTGFAPPSIR